MCGRVPISKQWLSAYQSWRSLPRDGRSRQQIFFQTVFLKFLFSIVCSKLPLQIFDSAGVARKNFHASDLLEFQYESPRCLLFPGSHNAIVRRNGEITGKERPIYFLRSKFMKLQEFEPSRAGRV
jgi:hypothetical protein